MPTIFKLINHDDIYNRLTTDKILLNTQDVFSTENREILDLLIMKNYSEDNLSIIPACQCGELKGAYYVGDVCHKCHTTVTSSVDDNISFLLWLQKPQEVEFFVSPIVLAFLLERYKITKPNIPLIKYIMVPNYAIDRKQQKKNLGQLEKLEFLLKQNNIKRGYNGFVQNFFKIIEILEDNFVKDRLADRQLFMDFLQRNNRSIFSNYLPFPNKIMFAMDTNELGKFIDKNLLNPINVIRRVTGIDLYTKPSTVKQLKIAKSLLDLAEFYKGYMKKNFFEKPGLIRKQTGSTRSHFTARAVITSIPGPHVYDELHLSWSLSCTLFREHILNRLYVRGYSYKQAINFLLYHNKVYSPIIDEIFREIIVASEGGPKALFNRNPSLHRGSIQTVRITRIKTDINDNTISMSYLIAKSFNADFDGDELNVTLVLTKKAYQNLCNFEPHHNVLSLNGPDEFSNAIAFPKTVVSTLSNWFNT